MRRARTTNRAVFLSPCHGRILKSPGKASKINDFTKHKGAYYATFESALMWRVSIYETANGDIPEQEYRRLLYAGECVPCINAHVP